MEESNQEPVEDILEDAQEEAPEAEEEAQAEDDSGPSAASMRLTYIQEMERKLLENQRTLSEYINAYKQVDKDKQEFKVRLEREKEKELGILKDRLVGDLLELMDNLDRSVMGAESSRNYDALAQGIRMVQSQFVEKLAKLGAEPIPTVGQAFDPNIHEALGLAPTNDPDQDGIVAAEYARGFRVGSRVLRPARVMVGKYSG